MPTVRALASSRVKTSENVSRSAGDFPSSAAVGGKRHFKFSPLRVATGCRLCTLEKGRPGLSLHVSIPCPRFYGLIRSCPHTRGRCEISSASAGFMSLPSGERSEHSHVIVRTENMVVVSHINHQGRLRSRTLNRNVRQLLLWAQDKFLSLRAVYVPGVLNLAADFLSRQKLRSGE